MFESQFYQCQRLESNRSETLSHKLPGGKGGESGKVITFSASQKGSLKKVIKKLNNQKAWSHKLKPTLYDSFTLLKVI